MTKLEEAEAVLADFKRSMDEGHPWLPGNVFIRCEGLSQHIVGALEDFVRVQRVAEQAEPAKRVSLAEE